MNDQQLRDEVMTMFVAGHETTAIGSTWLFPLLANNPLVLEQLLDEITTVLQGRTPTFADLPQLTYTRQVIDEILRISPPGWMFYRSPIQTDMLRHHTVDARSIVLLSPYLTHRMPEFWPNPETFDPTRFAPGWQKKQHPFAYFPFSAGQRKCIGDQFALMELMFTVVMMLQRFSLSSTGVVVPRPLVTLRPTQDGKIGVWMNIRSR